MEGNDHQTDLREEFLKEKNQTSLVGIRRSALEWGIEYVNWLEDQLQQAQVEKEIRGGLLSAALHKYKRFEAEIQKTREELELSQLTNETLLKTRAELEQEVQGLKTDLKGAAQHLEDTIQFKNNQLQKAQQDYELQAECSDIEIIRKDKIISDLEADKAEVVKLLISYVKEYCNTCDYFYHKHTCIRQSFQSCNNYKVQKQLKTISGKTWEELQG